MGLGRVVILAVLATSIAYADDAKKQAQDAVAHAKELHKAGKYREALDEMMRAYALDPQKDLLYAIAQLHVKMNNCPDAITFFRRYLAAKPDPGSAEKARQGILACENQPAIIKPPPPPPPDDKPPPPPDDKIKPPPPPPPRPTPKRSPWYADPLGDVLTGSGVVIGAVGLVEYFGARSKFSDASAATMYQDRVDGYADARSQRTVAVVLGAGGAALAIAGIVRYATRSQPADRGVALIVDPAGGGVVTWSGRW